MIKDKKGKSFDSWDFLVTHDDIKILIQRRRKRSPIETLTQNTVETFASKSLISVNFSRSLHDVNK